MPDILAALACVSILAASFAFMATRQKRYIVRTFTMTEASHVSLPAFMAGISWTCTPDGIEER